MFFWGDLAGQSNRDRDVSIEWDCNAGRKEQKERWKEAKKRGEWKGRLDYE
jgi:hypothetical protein